MTNNPIVENDQTKLSLVDNSLFPGAHAQKLPEFEAKAYKYSAFLSYSHRDLANAMRIQESLETFKIPDDLIGRKTHVGVVPDRLAPIFRDSDELQAGSLSEALKSALHESRFLIVVCSPAAVQSKWVDQEISYFKSLGRASFILCALVDSTNDNSGDVVTSLLPEALTSSKAVADGPLSDQHHLAADFRRQTGRRVDAKLSILSRLLGIDFDELKRRDAIRQSRRIAEISTEQVASGRADIGILLARDGVRMVPEKLFAPEAWQALFQALQEFRFDGALRCPDAPSAIGFCSDGFRLAVGIVSGQVLVWNYSRRVVEHTLAGHSASIRQCTFSSDGTRLLTISHDGSARIWDASTGALIWSRAVSDTKITVGIFLGGANLIALGDDTGGIALWRSGSTQLLDGSRLSNSEITCLAVVAAQQLLISASSNGSIYAWDINTTQPVGAFLGDNSPVTSLAVLETGDERLLACGTGANEGAAKVWRIPNAFPRPGFLRRLLGASWLPEIEPLVIHGFPSAVTGVALGGEPPRLSIASSDGQIEFRSPYEQEEGRLFEGEQQAPNRDPERIMRLFAAIGGAELKAGDVENGNKPIAVSERDLRYVAISSRQTGAIRLWDVMRSSHADADAAHSDLLGHTGPVEALHFSPCGRFVASFAKDSTVRLWFTQHGRNFWNAVGPNSLPVAPNVESEKDPSLACDARLIPFADGRVEVRDLTGQSLSMLEGHTDLVTQGEFGPNGEIIVTVSKDDTARLWYAPAGTQLCQLKLKPWVNPFRGADFENMDIDEFLLRGALMRIPRLESAHFTNNGSKVLITTKFRSAISSEAEDEREAELSVFDLSGIEVDQISSGKILCTSADKNAAVTLNGETLWAWNLDTGTARRLCTAETGWDDGAVERRVSFATANRVIVQWHYYNKENPQENGGAIGLFSTETGSSLNSLKWLGKLDSSFVVSGETLAFVNRTSSVTIWNLEDGSLRSVLSVAESSFSDLKINLQGDRLAVLDYPQTVHLWDCNSGEHVGYLSGHFNSCGWRLRFEFSPDGRRLATGGIDSDIRLWDTETARYLGILKHPHQVTPTFINDRALFAESATVERFPHRVWNMLPGDPALLDAVEALIANDVLPGHLDAALLSALGVDD